MDAGAWWRNKLYRFHTKPCPVCSVERALNSVHTRLSWRYVGLRSLHVRFLWLKLDLLCCGVCASEGGVEFVGREAAPSVDEGSENRSAQNGSGTKWPSDRSVQSRLCAAGLCALQPTSLSPLSLAGFLTPAASGGAHVYRAKWVGRAVESVANPALQRPSLSLSSSCCLFSCLVLASLRWFTRVVAGIRAAAV
jgi:hypothetical protein